MSFLVKLDEALSDSLADMVAANGYDARTVRRQGWGGTSDSALWPMVQAEGAFLITTDKGFADLRTFPPGSHRGVLLLRPDGESLSAYRALLASVLNTHRLETFRGCTGLSHLVEACESAAHHSIERAAPSRDVKRRRQNLSSAIA